MGVHLVRVKLWAYAIGASIGGFAGVFLGVFQNTINVDQFEFGFSVFILCMIILGGMGNLAGVILGAVALSMINRFLLPELNGVPEKFGLDFDVTAISFGIFGFLLLVMMVLRPEGFIPNRRRKIELHEDEFDDALIEVQERRERRRHDQRRRYVLEATGITKRFGGLVAVNDVDFAVPHKSIVAIIGPNGAGKTTFFNCMTGLYKPTTGQVLFDGRDITAKAPHIVTQAGIARTFQNIKLFKTMTVLENVQVGRHCRMKARITGLDPPHAVRAPRGARDRGARARAAQARRDPAPPPGPRRQPALRRPAPARDRARAGFGPQAAAARRADGRHEPAGVRGAARADGQAAQRAGHLAAADRARHEGGHERLRPHHRARRRRDDRRGPPQEVRANPRVIEAYLGSQA